ncbi:MAG TPA: bacillithiol biosynthesis cysteine-adding enzyme BshC [Edaphocola sp.]|nr:bacillithiol biosynthesis cysteine-adding enzyme BshC [Edaphocola sp.]
MQSIEFDCKASFVPVSDTGYFSNLVIDYLNNNENLKPFFDFELNNEGLLAAIEKRRTFPVDREKLVSVIQEQYKDLELSKITENNIISILQENTFTVCSAHQPNLMTGYMYFFYKIIHSVKMAQHLKRLSPNDNFVPVFFIGSEDNDFDELGHFKYNGKLYQWATEQTGAVGMMQSDENLQNLIESLFSILGPLGINEKSLKQTIRKAYKSGNSIAKAKQIFINELLGFMGVLAIDFNEHSLKDSFKNIIKKEILDPKAFELVKEASSQLQENYKAQAFFRPINLFYLNNGIRERIEKVDNQFVVMNSELIFSDKEIELEIDEKPEHFSPNVILRGLYQESILPNIAFIGGGSEVAYWMQLKKVFEYYNVFYPMIILRQSGLIMDEKTDELRLKLDLNIKDIFLRTNELVYNLIEKEKVKNWSLANYKNIIELWEEEIKEKLSKLDNNLNVSVISSLTKVRKQFDVLEKKINHSIKIKKEIEMNRIQSFKDHAFPNDSLQERYETFMPFYLEYGSRVFKDILANCSIFGDQFLILTYRTFQLET